MEDKPMIIRARQSLAALLALALWASPTRADIVAPVASRTWPNNFVARVEAALILQTLNADLLSHDSATLTLERWCADHRLASAPKIVAERVIGADKPPTEQLRRELGVSSVETVRYRRVRLLCGDVVLSEADNWYVPARLTGDMNKLLETTDIPFGRVVQALHFQRHTLSARMLWSLLPEGWEMRRLTETEGKGPLTIPSQVLEHRAILNLPDGTPFSEVVETYTGNVLAIPMQSWRERCPP
jgi:chorismate-pyruvate lyase